MAAELVRGMVDGDSDGLGVTTLRLDGDLGCEVIKGEEAGRG